MLKAEWNGKSCQDAGLISEASGAAISKSLVTLHPESVEGYQVTVWPKTGEAVTLPEVLTPKPPELPKSPPSTPTLPQPLGLILGCVLALLIGGSTLLLTTFKLPSSQIVGGLGMALSTLLLATALLFPCTCCQPPTTVGCRYFQGARRPRPAAAHWRGACSIPPRLACWWGREAWWVSVGSAVLVSVFVLLRDRLGNLSVEWTFGWPPGYVPIRFAGTVHCPDDVGHLAAAPAR